MSEPILVPFLKWAGGKRWLASEFGHLLPERFDRYVEPFLGGGAIFFHLQPAAAILSDKNPALINVYREIKRNWQKVRRSLVRHSRLHDDSYYYLERNRDHRSDHEKAAQFLYLNRTCWNGLYRVNLRGEFNVPRGTKNTVLLETDNFEATATALKKATLRCWDFEQALDVSSPGDFVFVDPPYVTRHNFNGFVKYNEHIFSWDDQIRLQKAIDRAANRGAKILITNAHHNSIISLYKDFGVQVKLKRSSIIAASSDNRGQTNELAIAVNYEPL